MRATPVGVFILFAAAIASAAPATLPAGSATKPGVDLSSPRATLLSVYTAMRAGDVAGVKACLVFDDAEVGEVFELNVAQVCAPLRLMHAMEGKFGEAGRKPFDTSVEKSIDEMLVRAGKVDIHVEGDTAVVGEKAKVNPNAETELSGVMLRRDAGVAGEEWRIVASTFPESGGEVTPGQLKLMKSMRDATVSACEETMARLERGEFHSADEAYAAYQKLVHSTARAAVKGPENPATTREGK
ncbi:MAG TPA: hypothetical protein VM008_12580 [Phycisphaerae bacterium]|nr:hypothetical protein [Phycisphaerae bacterium]